MPTLWEPSDRDHNGYAPGPVYGLFKGVDVKIAEDEWTDGYGERWTRQDFYAKVAVEGGIEGMVLWGGPGVFPPSLRDMAELLEEKLMDDDDG